MILANLVWPALVYAKGAWAWPVILAGLAVEIPLFRLAGRTEWGRAAVGCAAANFLTATVGLAALTIFDFVWAAVTGLLFNLDTMSPTTIGATYVAYVVLNTLVEHWLFRVLIDKEGARNVPWWPIAIGNALSVAMAFGLALTRPLV